MSEYYAIITGPTSVDAAGFKARSAGLEIRDSICIQRPEGPLYALVARGPLESTVVDEVVRRGTGVYDIDACRISGDMSEMEGRSGAHKEDNRQVYGKYTERPAGTLFVPNQGGRFPANLILVHGKGCKCVGTKKVKSGTAHQDNKTTVGGLYDGGWKETGLSGTAGYAGDDGKEEANWICDPSCPMKLMDEQSGILKSGALLSGQYKEGTKGRMLRGTTKAGEATGLAIGFDNKSYAADEGGASRFFYQATSLDDLEQYLIRLIGNNPTEGD